MEDYKIVMALIIISKGQSSASSYGLCRLLSRAFSIIECEEIIKNLLHNKYILRITDEISDFVLTEDGKQFIIVNKQDSIEQWKSSNPSNQDYGEFIISKI